MNQWVQQRGGYPNPVNPFSSLQPQALLLYSSAALSQAAGDGGGAPHPSWVLHPTLEPHIPRHPILPECPFSPAIPPHPNAPCPGHPIPPSFPYLGCIPSCCLCLFPGAGLFYSHPWLHLWLVTNMLLLQVVQFHSQYVMCFRAASVWLQRVFISERGLAVLTAAISNILTGVAQLPTAHTNPFASVFAAGLTVQLRTQKILPCPGRKKPTIHWRPKFHQHWGSGHWQITQQSPFNLDQSCAHNCISVKLPQAHNTKFRQLHAVMSALGWLWWTVYTSSGRKVGWHRQAVPGLLQRLAMWKWLV